MASHVLAIIPARGGSKGVRGKNIKPIAGRPLIAYAVDAARASGVVDRVIVSTDTEEIAGIGRACGAEVPFLRPAELAGDASPMLPVLEHAVGVLEREGWIPEMVLLLQPTSPLRTPSHLVAAVDLLRATNADSVVSVVELPRHLSPDYLMRIEGGLLLPFLTDGAKVTRRQDARLAYVRDGTVYAFWRRTLVEQKSLYGRDCRPLMIDPAESITIDTPADWAEAERRLGAPARR